MLSGKKPLAVFSVERIHGFTKADALNGQDFDSQVKLGKLNSHLHTIDIKGKREDGETITSTVDYFAYTILGEEWRAPAYFMLVHSLHHLGWCKHLERLEGTLLGYSDKQNDYHIKQKYP